MHEIICRTAGTGVKRDDIGKKFRHEFADLSFVVVKISAGEFPRGKIIPLPAAGSFRIRRNNFHIVANQIVPIANIFRIAFADKKNHRRSVRRRIVGEFVSPAAANQAGIFYLRHVVSKRKRHHVGTKSVDDCASLFAAAVVRLLQKNFFVAQITRPVLQKFFVVFGIKFACRVIRDVQKFFRRGNFFVTATA